MLLSQLNNGEFFRFLPGQKIYYILQHGRADQANEYVTNSHIGFEVLKKNEKSIVVKPVDGRVEYIFKFKGEMANGKIQGVDCNVERIKSPYE